MNFTLAGKRAVDVFISNPLLIIKISAVSCLLSVASFGLLGPAMYAALGGVFLSLKNGEKPGISALFVHVTDTFRLFGAAAAVAAIFIFSAVFIFLPVAVAGIFMYVPFMMAMGGATFGRAMTLSARAAAEKGMAGHIVSALIICALNTAGIFLFGVGLVITMPLTAGFTAFCYEELTGGNI